MQASWLRQLYVQVVLGIVANAFVGALDLETVRQVVREQRGEAPPRLAAAAHVAETVEPQG